MGSRGRGTTAGSESPDARRLALIGTCSAPRTRRPRRGISTVLGVPQRSIERSRRPSRVIQYSIEWNYSFIDDVTVCSRHRQMTGPCDRVVDADVLRGRSATPWVHGRTRARPGRKPPKRLTAGQSWGRPVRLPGRSPSGFDLRCEGAGGPMSKPLRLPRRPDREWESRALPEALPRGLSSPGRPPGAPWNAR